VFVLIFAVVYQTRRLASAESALLDPVLDTIGVPSFWGTSLAR
jgi:hypothetical protein